MGKTYVIRYVGNKLFENDIEINMAADFFGDIIFWQRFRWEEAATLKTVKTDEYRAFIYSKNQE